MLTTIEIGSCISVQGEFVARLPDGRVSVMVGDQTFTGRAADADAAAAARHKPKPADYRSVA